jgi:hypothetical protein
MADVADDASDLDSSEPADIGPQQASPLASPNREKLRVFISYSREDLKFADQLDTVLDFWGHECVLDRIGIAGGEDWKRRLGHLISEADTVVFVLSPDSARSEICDWEVEEAARLNKRILPIVCRPLEGVSPPVHLSNRNYIFFYDEPDAPGSGFGSGLKSLVTALNTDFDWLREHTRYLQRAMEWDAGGRPKNRLLSGSDIRGARIWAARRPKGAPLPTALHIEFLRASEESERKADVQLAKQRKQLAAVAAAHAERETALNKAEKALKQSANTHRKRDIALVAVSGLAVAALMFGGVVFLELKHTKQQWEVAEQQPHRASLSLDDRTLCGNALNNEKSGWDQTPRYETYVKEASRRGLTVDSCRLMVTKPKEAEQQLGDQLVNLDNRFVCQVALNSQKSGWAQGYATHVTEASRRGLTVDACRGILGAGTADAEAKPGLAAAASNSLFTIFSDVEASGDLADVFYSLSFEQCQQKCTQQPTCNAFDYNKRTGIGVGIGACHLYTRASLKPNANFNSGVRN